MTAHAQDYQLVRTAFIWLFSAAIIYAGSRELYRRHAHSVSIEKDASSMITALRGDLDLRKLCTDPEAFQAQFQAREQVQAARQQTLQIQLRELVP